MLVIFAVAALMALGASWAAQGALLTIAAGQWFIAFSMCILAMLKLQDIEKFSSMFLNYDLLAQRFVPYAYVYPFAELTAGVLMISGALTWLSIPIALFIGTIGAVSVVKAVYVDRRELKCACVGGNSNVPLGFISLTENVMMVAMALWMLARPLGRGLVLVLGAAGAAVLAAIHLAGSIARGSSCRGPSCHGPSCCGPSPARGRRGAGWGWAAARVAATSVAIMSSVPS